MGAFETFPLSLLSSVDALVCPISPSVLRRRHNDVLELVLGSGVAVAAALLLTLLYLWNCPPTQTVILHFMLRTAPFPLHTPGVAKGLLAYDVLSD